MWEKNNGTIRCDKRTVTCDVETAQCEDEIIKCEKKNKGTTECDKVQSYMMLKLHNIRMESSNVRKRKGTTECDKRTIICDVKIV